MTKFKDKKGGDWGLDLTFGMAEKLEADAGVSLDQLAGDPAAVADSLVQTPAKIARLLWVMCEDQAAERGVDPKAFAFLLDRPTLDRATEAFLEEFVLFYPRSSAGKAIAGRLPEMLRRMDEEIRRRVNEELDRVSSPTATGSPASSESTPAG